MTPQQCAMARAALSWSRADLAAAASVGVATVVRFEENKNVTPEKRNAMAVALESAGVELIPAGAIIRVGSAAAGPGVRLRS